MYSISPFVLPGVFSKALTPEFWDYMVTSGVFFEKKNKVDTRNKNLRLESKCI